MRLAIAAAMIAVLAALPASAERLAPPYLEAFCDGGIDGRWQHATVEPDGTIRAANEHDAAKPWEVVATEPELAREWFAAVEAASPAPPSTPPEIVVADGIECALELNKGQKSVRYDLPEILDAIVRYVPGYH
jgi:hypothetical protein